MLLSKLLTLIDYEACINFKETEIIDVTDISSEVGKGTVFVCIKGTRTFGEQFVSEASKRGCEVVVTSNKSACEFDKTIIISKNARKTLAEISKAIYFNFDINMKIVGITGTKGKTTTSEMIVRLLNSISVKTASFGTLGVKILEKIDPAFESLNTTPSSRIIYKALRAAALEGVEVAVIEVSSQALASYRVYGIPFDICIFTGLSEDHIGIHEHKNLDDYREAKRSLFRDYGAKTVIVNSLDPEAELMSLGVQRAIRVGKSDDDEYRISNIVFNESGIEFCLNSDMIRLGILGEYNVINAALAIATVSEMSEIDVSHFKDTLSKIEIPGRMEFWGWQKRSIIVDFAHNPQSFEAVFLEAKRLAGNNIIAVFGSVGDRSFGRRSGLASVAERYADISVITSDDTFEENAESVCEEIYGNFRDKSAVYTVLDRRMAIQKAFSLSNEGDFILILGKGHEKHQIVGGVRYPFSDQEVIQSLGAIKRRIARCE